MTRVAVDRVVLVLDLTEAFCIGIVTIAVLVVGVVFCLHFEIVVGVICRI